MLSCRLSFPQFAGAHFRKNSKFKNSLGAPESYLMGILTQFYVTLYLLIICLCKNVEDILDFLFSIISKKGACGFIQQRF